jgi:hypothetical protein
MKYYRKNEDLSLTQIYMKRSILLFVMCLSLLIFGGYHIYNQINRPVTAQVTVKTDYIDCDTLQFTADNLRMVINDFGIKFPDVVYRQSVLETGNFKSKVCTENNNYFGFRVFPMKWKGVQMPFKNRGHLVFKNWVESVKQYKLYQDANFKDKHYVAHLMSQGYAEDPNYANKLLK